MTVINEDVSHKITNLSFVCACLVVMIHCNGFKGDAGFSFWLWTIVGDVVGTAAVPCFFAISGFLLAGRIGEEAWYANAIRTRLRSLLIPFFAWCLLWVLIFAPISIAANVMAGRAIFTNTAFNSMRDFIAAFGLNPLRNPAVPSLWYVRSLFLLVLLSPVLNKCLRAGPIFLMWGTYFIVAQLSLSKGQAYLLDQFLSLRGCFYFTLGMYARRHGILLLLRHNLVLICGLLGFALSILLRIVECDYGARLLRPVVTPFLLGGLFLLVSRREWPKCLTEASFLIYVSHQLLMQIVLLPQSFRDAQGGVLIIIWIGLILAGFGISMAIRRKWPRFLPFLTGGR